MTGRSLHDALLRVLTSARLRALARAGDVPALAAVVGAEEARRLCEADGARLDGLARFLGRHFYRERIVRLFAACRRLARDAGRDPLALLDEPAFRALLARAEVGTAQTADAVAALVEGEARPIVAGRPWGAALLAYEGALFRVEAGPRRWGGREEGTVVVRAPAARLVTLDWDVTALVGAVRRGEPALPEPARGPTRLLVALGPDGRLTAVRASDGVERVLAALDAPRAPAWLAAALGAEEAALRRVLDHLAEVGAVQWAEEDRAAPAVATSSPPSAR
jgi:hypothetical protein